MSITHAALIRTVRHAGSSRGTHTQLLVIGHVDVLERAGWRSRHGIECVDENASLLSAAVVEVEDSRRDIGQ